MAAQTSATRIPTSSPSPGRSSSNAAALGANRARLVGHLAASNADFTRLPVRFGVSDTLSFELITPIVLAGGKGTRLWPMSRAQRPKQFLALTSDLSLFQLTLLRLADTKRYRAPIIVTNADYRFLVAEQALQCGVKVAEIILEPVSRNTAPAIASAALVAARNGPELVHVLPSDHSIVVDDAYWKAVDTAASAARQNRLATFGITPTSAATGFGYIDAGEKEPFGTFGIKRFVEKPDTAAAESMLAAGGFSWNSGMFLFRTDVFLSECDRWTPEVLSAASASVDTARRDLDFIRLDETSFASAPNISVDYAIFELTGLGSVVPSPIQWSDLGSWDAIWRECKRDDEGNMTRGPVRIFNARNSLAISDGMHVALSGLEDVAVLVSEDAIFIGKLSEAQNVGAVVKALTKDVETWSLTEDHPTTYQLWGTSKRLLSGERLQVRRLFVKPGQGISARRQRHRSKHWIGVGGTADVRIGDGVFTLEEGGSVQIPQNTDHQLVNSGTNELEVIEVRTGSHLDDDVVVQYLNSLEGM
jgi:mannose-1-phosphate guanylyltransferase